MVDHRLTPFQSHPYGLPPLHFNPMQKYGVGGLAYKAAAILAYHRRNRLRQSLGSYSLPYSPMIAGYRGFPLSTWASRIPSPDMPTRRGQYLDDYGGLGSPYQAPASDMLDPGRQEIIPSQQVS
ncbi:hypothetical protein AAF712_016717, partial [Marasmius tenuissimus]